MSILPIQAKSLFFPGQDKEAALYHIGAISPNLNRKHYAVECMVALIFVDPSQSQRQKAEPCRIRLDPLIPDESQVGPPSIELVLHGRWKTALKAVRRQFLMRVESATVTPAQHTDVHPHQLELQDPILNGEVASRVCVYVSTGCEACPAMEVSTVSYNQLARGLMPLVPVSPEGPCLSPVEQLDRKYSYVPSIQHLWNLAEHNQLRSEIQYNIYGVVLEARAPCITKGPDLRSEVVIVDQSSWDGTVDISDPRSLVLHRFERLPQDAVPFRAVGDIIRAHRVHVTAYHDTRTGNRTLQGAAKFYSTYVLWAREESNFSPIAVSDPVRNSRTKQRPQNIEHTITQDDERRVAQLREWSTRFFGSVAPSVRPFVKTVQSACWSYLSSTLRQPFDIICYFEGIPLSSDRMRFFVSDGPDGNSTRIRFLVEGCAVPRESDEPVAFDFFAPSWRLRTEGCPAWLLIRDAYVRQGPGSDFVFVLMAGEKTSTLLWLHERNPEVRALSLFVNRPGQCSALESRVENSLPQIARLPVASEAELCASSSLLDLISRPPGDTSSSRRANENVLELLSASKARSGEEVPGHASDELNKSACANEYPRQLSIITANANERTERRDFNFVRAKALALGDGAPPFRVLARVRKCSYPKDLSRVYQLWCEQCCEYFPEGALERSLRCAKCDGALCWSCKLQLLLEDERGTFMYAWFCGAEGNRFFRAVVPSEFARDDIEASTVSLRRCISTLFTPSNWLDCSIKPYVYISRDGIPTVECKVFATVLKPVELRD